MPKQLNSDYNEAMIPFSKMTFSPDVPSAALGPNEYNDGLNVETDVRGIRSMADRKSTRLNSSHSQQSRMPSSA